MLLELRNLWLNDFEELLDLRVLRVNRFRPPELGVPLLLLSHRPKDLPSKDIGVSEEFIILQGVGELIQRLILEIAVHIGKRADVVDDRGLFIFLAKFLSLPSFDLLDQVHVLVEELEDLLVGALLDHLQTLVEEHCIQFLLDRWLPAQPVRLLIIQNRLVVLLELGVVVALLSQNPPVIRPEEYHLLVLLD